MKDIERGFFDYLKITAMLEKGWVQDLFARVMANTIILNFNKSARDKTIK